MKRNPPDLFLLVVVLTILAIGLIIVTSASAPESLKDTGGKSVFFYGLRQLLFAVVGVVLMLFFMKFPYHRWKKYTLGFIVFTVMFLALVLTPLGYHANGAKRWMKIGFFLLQPSEFAKIAVIMFMAHYMTEIRKGIEKFSVGIFYPLILVGLICALIMIEPDMGTTIVVFGTFMVMLLMGGAKASHLTGLTTAGLGIGSLLIFKSAYRLARIFAFLNPWADARGSGWQTVNSLYALGSGGFFGMGLGMSRQKFYYLPEAHTDYIFSILGEELGLLGTATVIVLFFFLAWRGYKIALNAPDTYGRMMAAGITTYLVLQALLNIAVVTSSVPVTGITLPFLSYGGSSLVVSLVSIGILLNISKTPVTE